MIWIPFTLLAALMQAVRTAGQKQLAKTVSPLAATWVRYVFGLPFAVVYAVLIWQWQGRPQVAFPLAFWSDASLASVTQIGATVLLVRALTLRNFAVGTTYAKTEALQTALLSTLFFGSVLHWSAWVSIAIGFLGVVLVSIQKSQIAFREFLTDRAMLFGLGAGLGFALTSLWLRRASRSLECDFIMSAAITLAVMVTMQTVISGGLLWWRESSAFRDIWRSKGTSLFVGLTSALGSAGWFTAMTFQEAAYVKALGQIEFVATIALTYWYFGERISRFEWFGIVMILIAVLALTL